MYGLRGSFQVSEALVRKIRRREIWQRRPERRRNDVPRVPLIATLMLAGLRISELVLLDGRHLNFARPSICVPRVKRTPQRERSRWCRGSTRCCWSIAEFDWGHDDPVFATPTGKRNHSDNIRARIVAPAHDRANELLTRDGQGSIAHLTPHTLRRTFASLLAEVGVSPRRAMYLLGHTDPNLTMRVYQHVLDLRGSAPEQLEELLGCTVDEAFWVLSGREFPDRSRTRAETAASRRAAV